MAADTDYFTDGEKVKPIQPSVLKKLIFQEAVQRGHERKQKLLDALTEIAYVAVYVVPIALATLYLMVLVHKARSGQWIDLEANIEAMLIPVTTYLAGLLSRNILSNNNHE